MSDDEKPQPEPEVWAVVELLGHRKYAGRLLEVEKFGGKLGRVEVPQPDGAFVSVFFGHQSVYALSIVTEAVARDVARRGDVAQPVSPWDYPKALPETIAAEAIICQCGRDASAGCVNGRCEECCDHECAGSCHRNPTTPF